MHINIQNFKDLFKDCFKYNRLLSIGGFLLAILLIISTWSLSYKYFYNRSQKLFIQNVNEHLDDLTKHIQSYETILLGSVGFLKGVDHLDHTKWELFVKSFDIPDKFPGIQAIKYTPITQKDQVQTLEKKMQDEGLDRAIDSGRIEISGKVNLMQEKDTGFLMYLPFYGLTKDLDTVEKRRRSVKGFVSCLFNMESLMQPMALHSQSLNFEIYDGEDGSAEHLLYRSLNGTPNISHHDTKRTVMIGERQWTIYYTCSSHFKTIADNQYPLLLTLIGLISYFILLYIIMKLHRTKKILLDKTLELENEKSTAQEYLDIVNVMMLVLDTSKKVKLLNRRGCEIIGYSIDEVIGKDWVANFLPPNVHEDVMCVRDKLIQADKTATYYENPVLTKSGEERLIAWHNTPLFDPNGEFIGLLCSGEDITEIRQAELDLQNSKEFYQTMFSSLNDAIVILEDNIITDCNDSALHIFERDKNSLIGINILDAVYDIECKDYSFHHYLHSAHQGEYKSAECSLSLHTNPSESKIIEFTLSKFGAADENKLIMVARDITKETEDEKLFVMYSRQAQMGEMISMIAHQWRQPLAIINAIVSQMYIKAMISGEEETEYIGNLMKIETQTLHLSQTISDYRNFFIPDKPKEYFTLSSLIKNVLSLIDHTIKSQGIQFETNVIHDAVIYTYRNEILQVLIALLKNSVDMFEENKTPDAKIIITIDHDEKECFISVYDNAGGIPKDIINKLFVPYFTTKSKNAGTGLGLYMSKLIIHDHCNGKITVSSQANETIFTILLPYEKESL